MKLKEIANHERPRERFIQKGPKALSDAELLAIILQKGSYNISINELTNRLLQYNTLKDLTNLSVKELQRYPGIGQAKALQIKAIAELAIRINKKHETTQIKNSEDIVSILYPELEGLKQEHFITVLLNSQSEIIKIQTVSIGILNALVIHPREVFHQAIRESANSIIIAHNHPSGDPLPSPEDKEVTKQLIRVGKLMQIPVVDHIIIGRNHYFSFKDKSKFPIKT